MSSNDDVTEEEGLAFEIFEIKDSKKVNVRKIYFDGHIKGFEGDPVIVNYSHSVILQLKALIPDMLKQMNKDYRDLIEKHLLSDLPIYPIELSQLYQAQYERVMNLNV